MTDESVEARLKLDNYSFSEGILRALVFLVHKLGLQPDEEQQKLMHEISEALDARVQNEVEAQTKEASSAEPEEELFPAAEEFDTFLNIADGEVYSVIHKGVVFGKFCNEPVMFDHDLGRQTTCIKQWEHKNPEHEDAEGNLR